MLQRRTVSRMLWGVRIPLRDGVHLNATLYLPTNHAAPSPAIFTLTPYIGQSYHDRGMYFAAHGYAFLTVDVRGRGNSEGVFEPHITDGEDGHDVVEWLARQPFCNGKVAMWGGSYGGTNQWTTAAQAPPHLASIVPVASVYMGVDIPMRNNLSWPYLMQWLTLVSGHTSQAKIFEDHLFWSQKFHQWFTSGTPFKALDTFLGNPSPIFQEWLSHPERDAFWDRFNPAPEQYARLSLPVLTITGIYDNAQLGALAHYREHLKHTSAAGNRARHYLVIGPWDHAGTRTPQAEFAGLKCGHESIVDLPKLHLEWYAWTMQGGQKPEFLQNQVAYYVMGAEEWRYAESLEAVTAKTATFYLGSKGSASHILASGWLGEKIGAGPADQYLYDPLDMRIAELELESSDPLSLRPMFPTNHLTDQKGVYANEGQQLIYHSAPFEGEIEISGFFKLSVWLSIDQPDTDIQASIYEIDHAGGSLLMAHDSIRARYREGLREGKLIRTKEVLRYDFESFNFISRRMKRMSRLRLVIGPVNSIYAQKNYNSGGIVAEESMKDSRTVTVQLFHDRAHPSALYVPFGKLEG